MNIETRHEQRRGCGYRRAGGKYLVSARYGRPCGALPIELSICPTCHGGIKPARGWTWINLAALAAVRGCSKEGGCGDCPIADGRIQEVGLIWIGEKFYPTVTSFAEEADRLGVSRRISAIPRRFKLGETWVALAHRKVIPQPFALADAGEPEFKAGIFHVFKPIAIEYVVRDDDSEEKLERMEKQGITLVRVVPIPEKEAA
jgi:hypothetical protein